MALGSGLGAVESGQWEWGMGSGVTHYPLPTCQKKRAILYSSQKKRAILYSSQNILELFSTF